MQHPLSREVTWYALTAVMALLAFVVLSGEERSFTNQISRQQGVSEATVGDVKPHSSQPIRQISLLGERNSGTRWTHFHLSNCFNHTLRVDHKLTRYKHWFQYRNPTPNYKHDTLVIALFRDPYHWLEAMRTKPKKCPNHMGLQWSQFLTQPWTMPRIGLDLNISKDYPCQQDFRYDELNSCVRVPVLHHGYDGKMLRFDPHKPFYEHKQDGEPFANIMEMRAAKIRNFLDTKDYVGVADVWPVQYENLLSQGTKGMLDKISEWTGVPYKCDPFPAQNREKRELPKEFVKHVNKHLDWASEGLIGYTKEEVD